jgi:putative ABC transport system permease protein
MRCCCWAPAARTRSWAARYPFAEKHLGFDGHPTTIYVKAINSQVNRIDNLLAAQANPEDPSAVDVSQPSVLCQRS